MENQEFEKSKPFVIADHISYVPNAVLIKTIIRRITGNISAISFDAGETLSVKISPFDTFIHVLDGKAEIIIDDQSNLLENGECIIIPANCRNTIKAHARVKMISTIIKSGYEDVT